MARTKTQQQVEDIAIAISPSQNANIWSRTERNHQVYYRRRAREVLHYVKEAGYELVKKGK
jgi:hypothetical protein